MVFKELKNYVDNDMKTLLGDFKLYLLDNSAIMAQNFNKIISYSQEQIVLKLKNNELTIIGNNFKIVEMGGGYVVVKGEFKNLSFLRWCMKKYSFIVLLEGLNLDRVLKSLNNHNIKLYNCIRHTYKSFEFGIGFLDYLKVKRLGLFKGYKSTIKKSFNLGFLLHNLVFNIGLYIGFLAVLIVFFITSKTTLKIDVLGLDTLTRQEIITSLNNFGVSTGKVNSKNNDEIEKYLKQSHDKISLVSVVKKGTNLIVNIKEKITKTDSDINSLCAPYNMVIKSISVSQGVACVKEGDLVKKGDVLVKPAKILTNGQATELKPIAKIESVVWVTGNVEFLETETVYVKTGNKLIWSNYELFGKQIFLNTPQLKFENYEKTVYNNYVFKNMFLPLKLNKIVFYETKAKTIKNNFEDNKQTLISKSEEQAFSKLPKGVKVENKQTQITHAGNKYYVTTYLQINYILEG